MNLIFKISNKLFWPSTLIDGVEDKNLLRYLSMGLQFKALILLVARILVRVISTIITIPFAVILYILKYRVIYGCYFKQIGEASLLDSRIRCDQALKKKYKYIAYVSEKISDNLYLLDLYKNNVIFIKSLRWQILLFPIANNALLWRVVRIFDESKGRSLNYRTRSFNLYQRIYKKPLISFPEKDVQRAWDIISSFPNKKINKFVCLHVRTTSFDGGVNRVTRCADISTYRLAIEYLLKSGFSVIRIGDSGMPKLKEYENNPQFIDAIGLENQMFDIFCLSKCEFLVGTGSGPSDIPSLFGVSTITTNMFPSHSATRPLDGDLCIFKKLLNPEGVDNNLKFISSNVDLYISYERDFFVLGVTLQDNSADEILEVVKDFITGKSKNQGNTHSKLWKKNLNRSHRDFKSAGHYSEGFIKNLM